MKILSIIATLGPIGYIPYVPGTAAALAGAIFSRGVGIFSPAAQFGIILILAVVAVVAAGKVEKNFGRRDDQRIVIDELVGMLVAGYLVPDMFWLAAAFLLFRLFDITKIFGIRVCENLPGGYGIVFDDLAAGIYANLAWRVIRFVSVR